MTWEYRELQRVNGGVTGGYKVLEGVTGGYKGVEGVTGCYKGLQGVTKGLQRVPRGYRG